MGIHLNNIVVNDPDDKIIQAFNFSNNLEDSRCLIIASRKNKIKRTLIKDLGISKLIKITTVMKLDAGDAVTSCVVCENSTDASQKIGVITKYGMGLFYPIDQVSIISRTAAGVKNVFLNEDDEVSAIFLDDPKREFILIGCKQGMKRIHRELITIGNRTNKGNRLISQVKSHPFEVLNAFPVNNNDWINHVNIDGQ
jgi:DNA gyrase/topoisomerase IV subunit A